MPGLERPAAHRPPVRQQPQEAPQTDIILTLTPHIVRVLDLTEADLRPFRLGRDGGRRRRSPSIRLPPRAETTPRARHRSASPRDSVPAAAARTAGPPRSARVPRRPRSLAAAVRSVSRSRCHRESLPGESLQSRLASRATANARFADCESRTTLLHSFDLRAERSQALDRATRSRARRSRAA